MGGKSQYLSVGTVLNSRYRIVRFIKSGRFGNTYEAEDVNFDGMKVVIKELFIGEWCSRGEDSLSVKVSVEQNLQNFSRHIAKFKKEATILRQLLHTRIVRVIDVFEANGTAYYTMDYIDGESLSMRLKALKGGAMMESEVRKYLEQILEALEYVHSEGVLHLDLNPGNIMIDNKGKVILIDFGTSKQIEAVDGKSLSSSSNIAYTRGFAPTEQIEGEIDKMGTHTDMYALGATLYNLLTGTVPPSPSDILNSNLPEIKGISKSLQMDIIGLMQPSIKLRIKTVAELRSVLSTQSGEDKLDDVTPDSSQIETPETDDPETQFHGKKRKKRTTTKPQKKNDNENRHGNKKLRRFTIFGVLGVILIATIIWGANFVLDNFSSHGISTSREVDLGLSVDWAGWNVGASSPEGYGSLFAWGETSPKSGEYVESTYRYHDGSSYINIGSNISGTQYDAARANWGGSWRMPTKSECEELKNRCTWKWTTYNGVNGMKVTGPNGNSIFLPAAGWRDVALYSRGRHGDFWSGSLYDGSGSAWGLYFNSSGAYVSYSFREDGLSVRPVKAR